MRNGLLLTLGALAICLLPAEVFATAPIFTRVPGLICIDDTGDGAGSAAYSNVFQFDASVYDVNTADAELSWVFAESTANMTGVSGDLFTVNGIAPVVDPETPRTSASLSNLRNAAASFSILTDDTGATDAVNDDAVAAYTGTTAANATSDTVYTTITLAVSDGTNVTRKDIVVKVRPGGGDVTGGVSDVGVYGVTLNTGGDHATAGWTSNPQLLPAATSFSITGAGPVTITPTQQSGNGLGFGFAQSTQPFTGTGFVPGLFNIEPGKVYRARVQIESSNTANPTQSPEFQMRLAVTGVTFPANASMEAGSQVGEGLLTPVALTNNVYEVLYESPANPRLANMTHTTDTVQLFYDAIVFGLTVGFGTNSGDLQFSNTVIDAFDSPALGSNGALALWDTNAEFNTPAPGSINDTADANPNNNAGWKYKVQNANLGAPFPTSISSLLIPTTNAAQTTATFGATPQGGTSDTLTVFTSAAGQHLTAWSIGEPESVANNDGTIVPLALLQDVTDEVYYRVSTILRSSNASANNQPGFRLYVGHPFGAWQGSFEILSATAAPGNPTPGPVSTENTTYSSWVRGAPSLPNAALTDRNNFSIVFQAQDFAGGTVGGVTIIDTVVLELFPAAFF